MKLEQFLEQDAARMAKIFDYKSLYPKYYR